MIDIVVCTDHNYIMPCGVMLYSLCENNKKNEITFYVVVDDSVSDDDRKSLIEIADNYPSISIEFISINGDLFDNFPNLTNVYVSKATYYRLYLGEILPKTINKVLYLDCDMIIRKDLEELWNIDISNYAVGACMDGMEGLVQLYNRLDYPMNNGYFNAGMLLINLNFWREKNILNKCLNFIEQHHNRIVSHDQDVLNVILQDSKVNISLTYNFGECFLYKTEYMQFEYSKHKREINSIFRDPAIVHYTISKPWKKNCNNPYKSIFFQYRNKTKWKDCPLEKKKIYGGLRQKLRHYLSLIGVLQKPGNPFQEVSCIV